MAPTNPNELTFEGLKRFLCQIGFGPPAKIKHSLAFYHPRTETMIVLSVPKDGRSLRPADLLSVLMRLEADGLANEAMLEQFRSGHLPLAS